MKRANQFRIGAVITALLFIASASGNLLLAQGGPSDSFPAYDDGILPGQPDQIRSVPGSSGNPEEPGTVDGNTTRKEDPATEPETGNEDSGPSWWEKIFDGDKSVFNAIFVLTLIVLFILFRIRAGNNRRSL